MQRDDLLPARYKLRANLDRNLIVFRRTEIDFRERSRARWAGYSWRRWRSLLILTASRRRVATHLKLSRGRSRRAAVHALIAGFCSYRLLVRDLRLFFPTEALCIFEVANVSDDYTVCIEEIGGAGIEELDFIVALNERRDSCCRVRCKYIALSRKV